MFSDVGHGTDRFARARTVLSGVLIFYAVTGIICLIGYLLLGYAFWLMLVDLFRWLIAMILLWLFGLQTPAWFYVPPPAPIDVFEVAIDDELDQELDFADLDAQDPFDEALDAPLPDEPPPPPEPEPVPEDEWADVEVAYILELDEEPPPEPEWEPQPVEMAFDSIEKVEVAELREEVRSVGIISLIGTRGDSELTDVFSNIDGFDDELVGVGGLGVAVGRTVEAEPDDTEDVARVGGIIGGIEGGVLGGVVGGVIGGRLDDHGPFGERPDGLSAIGRGRVPTTPPRVRKTVKGKTPKDERGQGTIGCQVRVQVDEKGVPTKADADPDCPVALWDSAERLAMRFRFDPAERLDEAVATDTEVTVLFED